MQKLLDIEDGPHSDLEMDKGQGEKEGCNEQVLLTIADIKVICSFFFIVNKANNTLLLAIWCCYSKFSFLNFDANCKICASRLFLFYSETRKLVILNFKMPIPPFAIFAQFCPKLSIYEI